MRGAILYLHCPNTSSWCLVKHRGKKTLFVRKIGHTNTTTKYEHHHADIDLRMC